jgi:hypothetical protein
MGVFTWLWTSRPIVFVRAAAEIYGIAVGVSALLGFLAPSVAEVWLNLSSWQKVGIGASTFIIVLSLMLQIGKPLLKRRASLKERLESLSAELQNAEQERDKVQAEYDSIRGSKYWGEVKIAEVGTLAADAEAKRQIEELKSENEELKKKLDKRKRKRIEWWRESFDKFDFANHNVLLSAAYADISEFLKDDIRDALQNRSHLRVELDARTGGSGLILKGQDPASQKTLLLDEVTRIGREEWERI